MGGTELELKFDAELDAELPSFSDLASSAVRQVVLTSTYWDTADRRIMALGCSLRFRSASDGSEPAADAQGPCSAERARPSTPPATR